MPPVVIRGDAIDVEAIQAAIRRRVELRTEAGRTVSKGDAAALGRARLERLADWNFPDEIWQAMWPPNLRPWNLDEPFPLASHRRGLGPLLVLAKRWLRRVLNLAARPLVARQVEINRTLSLIALTLADEATALGLRLEALERRTARMATALRESHGETEPLVVFADESEGNGVKR